MSIDRAALDETLRAARERLIRARGPEGHWTGELSGSALSTATAVGALALMDRDRHAGAVRNGLRWLVDRQNADGGWGDTVLSDSNIATTLLAWSAFAIAAGDDPALPRGAGPIAPSGRRGSDGPAEFASAIVAAEDWLTRAAGGLHPDRLVEAVYRRYGTDRTFSVPILSMAALAGRLGPPGQAWRRVKPLPFELAVLPHGLWSRIGLPVVSYALPALIALGQLRYRALPPRNPCARLLRRLVCGRSLRVLQRIQPGDGGFLEAAPLTAFVTMAMASMGLADHPVARKGEAFLLAGARADGSWPIDTNLATWVTTLSVDALSTTNPRLPAGAVGPPRGGGVPSLNPPDSPPRKREVEFGNALDADSRRGILDWLLAQQHRGEHPYTHAAPGGWAWTDLPGGVPDADDTAGALLALAALGADEPGVADAAAAGAGWLLGLQNRDGGMPTFCRGWQRLPFDRSASDLTAHAIAAWAAWRARLPEDLRRRTDVATARAVAFLRRAQRPDGAWAPLWFGNEHAPDAVNLVYGTARVVSMLARVSAPARGRRQDEQQGNMNTGEVSEMLARAARWLVGSRNADGGWGGAPGVPPSIEETALAVGALASMPPEDDIRQAVAGGAAWLIEHTDRGRTFPPAPIGFYFAQLWYFEALYPLIFTVAALSRAADRLTS